MLISEKIGGLPVLSAVFNHGPYFAAGAEFLFDFLIIGALMCWPENLPPWKRGRYKTFEWFAVIISVYMFMATLVLEDAPKLSGFYTERWWHVSMLILGLLISLGLEAKAMHDNVYNWSQEFSPSKLYHTIIFGVVFYWIASTIVPVLVAHRPPWATVVAVAALLTLAIPLYFDMTRPPPKDAHLEGNWQEGWRVRQF